MTYDNDPHAGRSVAALVGLTQREVGDWENDEVRVEASGPLGPHLAGPAGAVRTGALVTMCDNAAGFTGGLASLPDGWVVSTNMSFRRFALPITGPIAIQAEVLRRGRRAVITAARVADRDGAVVADCVLTSSVLVPEGGPPHWERPAVVAVERPRGVTPLLEALGIDENDDDPVVRLEVDDQLRNPWGIVHGGVTATLVDVSGERAVRELGVDSAVTTDMMIHYLAPGRSGPLVGRTHVLGPRADGHVCRVEVVDDGEGGRTVAVAATTVRRVRSTVADDGRG